MPLRWERTRSLLFRSSLQNSRFSPGFKAGNSSQTFPGPFKAHVRGLPSARLPAMFLRERRPPSRSPSSHLGENAVRPGWDGARRGTERPLAGTGLRAGGRGGSGKRGRSWRREGRGGWRSPLVAAKGGRRDWDGAVVHQLCAGQSTLRKWHRTDMPTGSSLRKTKKTFR